MASSISFEERIARIEARAAAGQNTGFVTPGVAEAHSGKAPRARKSRKPQLGSVMGGAFATMSVLAVGVAFAVADVETGHMQDIVASLSLPEN